LIAYAGENLSSFTEDVVYFNRNSKGSTFTDKPVLHLIKGYWLDPWAGIENLILPVPPAGKRNKLSLFMYHRYGK
jgi:hypothetical protein